MQLTRKIRHQMGLGLALVLGMVGLLVFGGLSGLASYRGAVQDLDFAISESPRRADLVAAVGLLAEPLLVPPADQRPTARFQQSQQDEFLRRLESTRERIREYERKLDRLPPMKTIVESHDITRQLLQRIHLGLQNLDRLQADMVTTRDYNETLHAMSGEVLRLSTVAQTVPDYQLGLHEKLQSARKVYRSRSHFLYWSAGIAFVLFLIMAVYVHSTIFRPLTTLHNGAVQVAQGDFDLEIDIRTDDEMGELAEAFNKMTARFREIRQDLDRQVRERSKQLVRSERLAGLGFLAAGVAHEINNPLQAITVAAESLEGRADEFLANADPADAHVVRQYLGMIRGESIRCKEITARLLNFARGQDTARSRFDLVTIITEVLSLVSHLSKYRDRKIEFFPKGPCQLVVNGPEIKQVVLNLVSNALESMEPGGTLRIKLVEQTDQVVVSFHDQGCGMTPDVINNLFEPFFTQRKDGKGTGLGLSISHRIVSEHGGTIEALSDGPGQGSTFHLHLPKHAASGELAA